MKGQTAPQTAHSHDESNHDSEFQNKGTHKEIPLSQAPVVLNGDSASREKEVVDVQFELNFSTQVMLLFSTRLRPSVASCKVSRRKGTNMILLCALEAKNSGLLKLRWLQRSRCKRLP